MSNACTRLDRRRFLFAAAIGLITACASGPRFGLSRSGTAGMAQLTGCVGDPAAAARLGRAWLAAHPAYREGDRLISAIEADLAQRAPQARDAEPDTLTRILERLVREDYIRGDTELVDGWVLSRFEARLYALTALPKTP